jgi:hypothetical protein
MLNRFNLQLPAGFSIDTLKSVLLRERVNLSYYDNLLLSINSDFHCGKEHFILDDRNPFHVYDEVVQILRDDLESKESNTPLKNLYAERE